MKNVYAYWGVYPDFLKVGQFTVSKRDEARQWCLDNCKNKFISSDLKNWAFLSETDAIEFQKRFGGWLKFKDVEE
jgi:hypothetical protein